MMIKPTRKDSGWRNSASADDWEQFDAFLGNPETPDATAKKETEAKGCGEDDASSAGSVSSSGSDDDGSDTSEVVDLNSATADLMRAEIMGDDDVVAELKKKNPTGKVSPRFAKEERPRRRKGFE